MTEVIMGGWLSIPLASLSTDSIELIKSELTYVSKFIDDNGKRKQILLYDIDGEFIHTPREWARHNIRRFVDDEITCRYEWIDEPVEPFYSRLPDPNHPKVLDPIQQKKFMDDLEHAVIKKKNVLAVAMTGCHAKNTKIVMYDGSLKNVEDIKIGDMLMGPDSTPRRVIRLHRGRDTMVCITPKTGGNSFIVNKNHILSLKRTAQFKGVKALDGTKQRRGEVINISLDDYINTTNGFKHLHKLYKPDNPIVYENSVESLPIDPYFLGLWLGDGSSDTACITSMDDEIIEYVKNYYTSVGLKTRLEILDKPHQPNKAVNIYGVGEKRYNYILDKLRELNLRKNKHIPKMYLTSSVSDRCKLLAGLIDTDGHVKNSCVEFTLKDTQLFYDLVFLARSLGCTTKISDKIVNNTTYKRAFFSIPNNININTILTRKHIPKRTQKKCNKISGFTYKLLPEDDFYGFEIDGDHLYLTEDFTVHHNSGKTAVSLYVAAKLNRKILILVNKNALRDQWIDEIQNHLGIPSEMIATIQGPKCKLDGKVIAVGLLQSFARRQYPQEVYDFASTLIVDECHNLSTEFFGKVIPKIKAKYRILLSATPTRKDGSDIVLYYHCGNPRVISANRSMDIDVIVKKFTPDSMWGDNDRTQLFHLTRLKKRNQFLTDIISELYKDKRKILAISHSVDHLDKIYAMLMTANINPDDVGYFTGSINDSGKRRTLRKDERDVSKTKRIILATYGAFKEGVDVPDLDAGIDLSPNYKGNQVIGRVRRYVPGKRKPKWITIFDDKSMSALKMFQSRIKEYKQAGANIVYE